MTSITTDASLTTLALLDSMENMFLSKEIPHQYVRNVGCQASKWQTPECPFSPTKQPQWCPMLTFRGGGTLHKVIHQLTWGLLMQCKGWIWSYECLTKQQKKMWWQMPCREWPLIPTSGPCPREFERDVSRFWEDHLQTCLRHLECQTTYVLHQRIPPPRA